MCRPLPLAPCRRVDPRRLRTHRRSTPAGRLGGRLVRGGPRMSAEPLEDITTEPAALVVEHAQRAIARLGVQTARLGCWGHLIHHALADGGLVMAAGNGG